MLLVQIVVFQIIVFGAVIYFLKRILYRDTESSINRLDRVYQDMLKKQKDLTQKIEQAEKEYNEKKEESTLIASKLKTEALDEARQKQDELVKKARAEAEEVVKRAHQSADSLEKEIEKKLKKQLIEESSALLRLSLPQAITAKIHAELVKEFPEKMKTLDLGGVGSHIDTLTIKTAIALNKEELNSFSVLVSSKINRPIKIEEVTDQSLIAGVLFQFGTLIVDGSLLNSIRESTEQSKKTVEMGG